MFETLPGFREFYPEQCAIRNHFFRSWRLTAHRFGFAEYDAPVLESLDLFRVKSGDEIVDQLFSFTDRGGREVALRPEMTPSLARMVGARANSLKRPIKWFSIGEQYRYERQQRGRLRAFYQFNADIFGEAGPEAEIELIGLLIQSLTAFGLRADDFYVRLSDRDLWFYYLRGLGLGEEAVAQVLTVVDKIGREPEEVTLEKLRPFFGDDARDFWGKIGDLRKVRTLEELEQFLAGDAVEEEIRAGLVARLADWRRLLNGLEAMGLKDFVEIDLGVVRGLAYYTGFVFEAFDRKGELRALAGGGRYDHLLGKVSKADLPAVGFAIGDVVLHELLQERGLAPKYVSAPDLYLVIGGEAERKAALGDIYLLREAGYRVDYPLKQTGFGKQFKTADQSGARLALIYGEDEVAQRMVKIRDLRKGEEQTVSRTSLLPRLAALFG
jgi:histidyl-tRNA synthetase